MKHCYSIICSLLLICASTSHATTFKKTRGWPDLRITGVLDQTTAASPLTFMLMIHIPDDATPFVISADWLSARIYRPQRVWEIFSKQERLYDGDVFFAETTNTVVRIEPGQTRYMLLKSFHDRRNGNTLSSIPKGAYEFRIYLTGGEQQEFDYQWMGQTFSPNFKLHIKDIPTETMDDN